LKGGDAPFFFIYCVMLSYEKLIEKIEASIAELETNKVPLRLYEPITYIMGLGGKRMRPMLVLLSYSLFKDDADRIIKPAVGVEVFHNFTLMHDDIMDAAPLRRGMSTVHTKWDANVAILSGDVMLVEAYRLMMAAPDMNLRAVINHFSKTAAEVCEGQMLDMDFELLPTVTVDEYINMIRLKTAVLLGFSLQLGGLLAGVDDGVQRSLYDVGVKAGIGFQLMDDLLDVYGDAAQVGKQVGGDIIANKKTYLLLRALELTVGKDDGDRLVSLINVPVVNAELKVNAVKKIYDSVGIREETEKLMRNYFNDALYALSNLDVPNERKESLRLMLVGLMGRVK